VVLVYAVLLVRGGINRLITKRVVDSHIYAVGLEQPAAGHNVLKVIGEAVDVDARLSTRERPAALYGV
jgi:hypothetical protein